MDVIASSPARRKIAELPHPAREISWLVD